MYRVVVAVLCLAAAGGLGYSAFSDRWLQNMSPSRSVQYSLLASKRCESATCQSKSNADLMTELAGRPKEEISRAFVVGGQATLALSLVAALALAVCGLYLIGKKRTSGPNGPQHLALLVLMLTLVAATVFIKNKPGGATTETGVETGLGFWVFGVACVLGIFAAQFAGKLIKPVEPEPDAL